MRRTWLTCIFGVLSIWPSPPRAQAHSVELLTQLAFHPSDPGVMALRYVNGGNGLLYTHDAGASWQVLCASAIGGDDTEAGPIAITGDGTTLMGLAGGLWHDESRGCAWSKRADFPGWVSDFVPDPLQPGATYAATWTGGGALNGVVRRDESGLWTDVGAKEQVLISRLRVVKRGAGVRFYESVIRAGSGGAAGVLPPGYLIRSSDDLGASWDEHPFRGPQGKLTLQAVDPTDSDRLVVLVALNSAESRLPQASPLIAAARIAWLTVSQRKTAGLHAQDRTVAAAARYVQRVHTGCSSRKQSCSSARSRSCANGESAQLRRRSLDRTTDPSFLMMC